MGTILHKNLYRQSIATLLLASVLCSPLFAETQPITADSVNLSAGDFLPEFINQSPKRRAAARLYLLGVLDATEGKSWCSYSQLKTATINEFVFEYLKKQPSERLTLRASVLIEEALQKSFPCTEAK
jgi:hypothetical protein